MSEMYSPKGRLEADKEREAEQRGGRYDRDPEADAGMARELYKLAARAEDYDAAEEHKKRWIEAELAKARQENPNAQKWQVEKDVKRKVIEIAQAEAREALAKAPDLSLRLPETPRTDEGADFERFMREYQIDSTHSDHETLDSERADQ